VNRLGWLTLDQYGLAQSLAKITPGTGILAFCAATAWMLRRWTGALVAVGTGLDARGKKAFIHVPRQGKNFTRTGADSGVPTRCDPANPQNSPQSLVRTPDGLLLSADAHDRASPAPHQQPHLPEVWIP